MSKKKLEKLYCELHQKWYDRRSTTAKDIILIDRAKKFILEAMLKVSKKT